MKREEILAEIREVMEDYIEDLPETLDENMSLANDIGIDSFALASMICAIEDKFNVKIPDRELSRFVNLKDMVDFILK